VNSVFRRESRDALVRRLKTLQPDDTPRWGRMNAPQMVVHVGEQIRMGLGEVPTKPIRTPLRHFPLAQLTVYWLPWPKGVPTAPELLVRPPATWQKDVAAVGDLLERCGARGPAGPWAEHPAFGRLSGRAWGVLLYRHTDHHLRQFGR
jgi:hypothetical protein